LRVFGTGALPQGCEDTDLVVPLAASNQGEIEGTLGEVEAAPESDSAVAQAMVGAIRDMASTDGPHSIASSAADLCNPGGRRADCQEAERADRPPPSSSASEVPPMASPSRHSVELIPGATYTTHQPAALRSAPGIQTVLIDGGSVGQTGAGRFYLPTPVTIRTFRLTGAIWTIPLRRTLTGMTSAGARLSHFGHDGFLFPGHDDRPLGLRPEGITSYDFGSFSGAGFEDVMSFEVVDSSGAWFPAADLMVPGYSWGNDYTMNIASAFEGASFSMSAATSQSWTVTGMETVSFGGEERDALRIDGTSTTTTTAAGLPIPIPTMTNSETFWLVEGVGIVRFSNSGEGYSSTGEMTSYSIP
jgi:hypothetical protein